MCVYMYFYMNFQFISEVILLGSTVQINSKYLFWFFFLRSEFKIVYILRPFSELHLFYLA